jgi:Rrf2 family protein
MVKTGWRSGSGDGNTRNVLSSKAKYAIRATVMLAERYSSAVWVPTNVIAERERIPRKFLESILVHLRDNGMVDSRRGSLGGHRLARDPAAMTVADVIRTVDGPLALTPCASVTRFRPCTDCGDVDLCRLRHVMRDARDAVADVLEHHTIGSLAGLDEARPHVAEPAV